MKDVCDREQGMISGEISVYGGGSDRPGAARV